MAIIPQCILDAAQELSHLPGIGPRTAQRLAFYLLKRKSEQNNKLATSIEALKDNLHKCPECSNYTDNEGKCAVCLDPSRNRSVLCIVESPIDAFNIENTAFQGLYHILHGTLSPIDGITAKELELEKLFERIKTIAGQGELEVILGTNPSMEGESTAIYIENHIKDIPNITITRLARGLPMGADLEYIDEMTLQKAFEGRYQK